MTIEMRKGHQSRLRPGLPKTPPRGTLPSRYLMPSLEARDLARALPSGWAWLTSRGRWVPARHLTLLTQKLMDLEQRKITRLIVECPPRAGKTSLCSRAFPSWYLGRHPDHQVILASYEGHIAQLSGELARDALAEYGMGVFGVTVNARRSAAHDWRVADHLGRMRCTGITGGITGRGADLLIVDDPVKDAVEANSETYRQRVWDWWTSTASTRLEPNGIVIAISTRWHQDDLIGRLRQQESVGGERWDSVTLPAIAEEGQPDSLGREPGAVLWPERFPLEVMLRRKQNMPAHWWNALYQQRPTPPGGQMAQRVWFPIVTVLPPGQPRRCRFWDMGGDAPKKGSSDPDWTVGARLARYDDGQIVVEDIVRVRASSADVHQLIRQTALMDGFETMVREEQEGGSSGKAIINMRKLHMQGFNYMGQQPLGKPDGWTPLLIQAEMGHVSLFRAPWNEAFLNEVSEAPHGHHDDQLDAVAGAFHALTIGSGLRAADVLSIGADIRRDEGPRMQF